MLIGIFWDYRVYFLNSEKWNINIVYDKENSSLIFNRLLEIYNDYN